MDNSCLTILALIDFAAYNGVIVSSKSLHQVQEKVLILCFVGVVDIAGTYDPLEFTDPLPQLSKLYKVLELQPSRQSASD